MKADERDRDTCDAQNACDRLEGPEALDAVRERAVENEQDQHLDPAARQLLGHVHADRDNGPAQKRDYPRERVRRDRLQALQAEVYDESDSRQRSTQMQKWNLLQERDEFLRSREDEDNQERDAREREHGGGLATIASAIFCASVSMRERFATVLHRAGALSAVMQVRKLAPVPSTVSILTYHHVAAHDPAYPYDPGVADASPTQFRRQMEMLARHGTPIGIDELVRALAGAPLPKNPVMVTFDDGYRSCHDVALPILRAVGMRAVFFLPTGYIQERKIYWWERIEIGRA